MENKTIKTRESSFELLRIFAMFMIVAHHLSVHGVQQVSFDSRYLSYTNGSFFNQLFTCFLIPGGKVGVALFFMITGFFMCRKENFSVKKVVIQSAFCSVVTGVLFLISVLSSKFGICGGGYDFPEFSGKIHYVLKCFFQPVTSNWWFVSAYVILILCCPLINKYIVNFSKRTFIIFLFISWAFLYSVSGVLGNEYYSLIRAFFFYLLGAFIRFYSEKFNASKIVFAVLACVVLWIVMAFCFYKNSLGHNEINSISFFDAILNKIYFILEHCISLPLFAFLFFKIFMSLNIKENSFINKTSSLTFGVYLIHDSTFGRYFIWNHLLHISDRQFNSKYFPFFAILDILLVFLICSVLSSAMLHFTQKIEKKWRK
ncbi:MAG: acyltransferase family protein [Spirochaetia bacterium]|nr:acyltransferase family protein [Spirochaetia bacterium]